MSNHEKMFPTGEFGIDPEEEGKKGLAKTGEAKELPEKQENYWDSYLSLEDQAKILEETASDVSLPREIRQALKQDADRIRENMTRMCQIIPPMPELAATYGQVAKKEPEPERRAIIMEKAERIKEISPKANVEIRPPEVLRSCFIFDPVFLDVWREMAADPNLSEIERDKWKKFVKEAEPAFRTFQKLDEKWFIN